MAEQVTLEHVANSILASGQVISGKLDTLIGVQKSAAAANEPSLRDKATSFMGAKPTAAAPAAAAPSGGGKGGGAGGGGGGGIGLGGMAVAGIAGLAAGLAGILAFDANAIKNNVSTLLTIVDLPNMSVEAVAGVSATLAALGTGLAAFGIGSAIAGVGDAVASFLNQGKEGSNWIDNIHYNVKKLLSIVELENMTKEAVAGVSATLGALGLGLAAFGIGTTVAGVSEAVNKFIGNEKWAEKIKENITTLLSIIDLKNLNAKAVAGVAATLGALGLGLAAFGFGKAADGVGTAITKFTGGESWAQKVVDNVKILVDMAETWDWAKVAGTLVKFPVVMGALGLGLAMFGAGKAVEGVGEAVQGGAEHIQKFTKGDGFGERVKKEVTSLLSILDDKNASFTGGAGFIGVMGAIGAGLVAYSVGKGAEAAASGAQTIISSFHETPFADRVKEEVTTLLSITTLPGVDLKTAANFGLVMGGIGAGLVAFSIGKGAEAAASGGQAAVKKFTEGEKFADRVKLEVTTLLGILENKNVNTARAEEFSSVMGSIAAGLTKFAASKFISAFAEIGTAIASFFTGKESSIGQILKLADRVEDLKLVGESLDKITGALQAFGNIKIDTDDLAIDKLVQKLAKALPWIDALGHGGELDGSGVFSDTVIKKGLLDPTLELDEMVDAINKVNQVLGISGTVGQGVAPGSTAAAGATKSEMVQQVAMQAGTVTLSSPSVVVNVPGQEGGAEGQRPNSPGMVHTSGSRQDGSAHKFTYGKVSMPG